MKKLIFTVIFTISSVANMFSQENILQLVASAAEEGLKDYLTKIPKNEEKHYGFNSRDEFSQARIGKIFEVFTPIKDVYMDEVFSEKKKYFIATGEWRIAITVNGENRALITVAKMKGVWEAVAFGSEGQAKELEQCEKIFPSNLKVGKLLCVFNLESDFFITPLTDEAYPLASARMSLGINNEMGAPYSYQEIFSLLKNNTIK